MDTFDFYNYAGRHGHQYDTIVIDPPSFARNKKNILCSKDYNLLIEGALNILSPGGTLLLCTNSSAFLLRHLKRNKRKH